MKNKLKRLLICLLAAGISLVGTAPVSQAAAKRPRLNILQSEPYRQFPVQTESIQSEQEDESYLHLF